MQNTYKRLVWMKVQELWVAWQELWVAWQVDVKGTALGDRYHVLMFSLASPYQKHKKYLQDRRTWT